MSAKTSSPAAASAQWRTWPHRGSYGRGGIAAVIKSEDGQVLFKEGMLLTGEVTVQGCEYSGLIFGLFKSVERNRKFRFEAMGFASYIAAYLASTKIDVTQMQALLDKGCPHEFALQILVGTGSDGN